MKETSSRTAQDVFNDHLELAQQGKFDEDISKNFSEDCVVLTNRGAFRGHEGGKVVAQTIHYTLTVRDPKALQSTQTAKETPADQPQTVDSA